MSSKQEKLAAARRKLKEFQGKNKEIETSKDLRTNESVSVIFSKETTLSSPDSSSCSEQPFTESKNLENIEKNLYEDRRNVSIGYHQIIESGNQTNLSHFFTKTSNSPFSVSGEPQHPNNDSNNYNNYNKTNSSEKLGRNNFEEVKNAEEITGGSIPVSDRIPARFMDPSIISNVENSNLKNRSPVTESKYSKNQVVDCNVGALFQPISVKNSSGHEKMTVLKDVFADNLSNEKNDRPSKSCSALSEVIKPLQEELENHVRTINLLIQQRNDAQNALSQAQKYLMEKTEEIEKLQEIITGLTSSVNDSQRKISEDEKLIKILKLEREENLQKNKEAQSCIFQLKSEAYSMEEKYQEMKRKHEEKCKEYQQLLVTLQNTQSQLSLSQIQVQQFSGGVESRGVPELQKENMKLQHQIEELKKKLETDQSETEQSSQHFFTYAQQCKAQLADFNSRVKNLMEEKEKLGEENTILRNKLSEMEILNKKEFSENSRLTVLENEIAVVIQENKTLQKELKMKDEEIVVLCEDSEKKNSRIKSLEKVLKQVESENERLMTEAEAPKADEKLLAVIESDKVAAAKAVSQNQKLKQQVVELEQAFVKLSEEKLELTNRLGQEKHKNTELQKLLKNEESSQHQESHLHDTCFRGSHENAEPLVNDSNEVEELRNIVRQLQDDKVELKARLNALESNMSRSGEEKKEKNCDEEVEKSEEDCESTKLLLQKMEEKVRKTMNEIAVLDEEKEKLEHLVLQLQGETETIGEYITLYQTQRRLLQQRAVEKDKQLIQLSKDKEELKSKLCSLDELVNRLVGERQNGSRTGNYGLSDPCLGWSTSPDACDDTAGKIRALIGEIGSSSWIDDRSVAFEHCSCCSGRLITI